MALNATDLANDLKNDTSLTGNIPTEALPAFQNFCDRIAVHITAQIQRGTVDDVRVNTDTGNQNNISTVK